MNRLFLLLFGMVTFVAHAQVPDYVPTEGLVAWYPFNGNANDESGNGYHCESYGAVLTDDRDGTPSSAFDFDGQGSHLRGTSLPFSDLSISLWFRHDSGGYTYTADPNSSAPTGAQLIGQGTAHVPCSWSDFAIGFADAPIGNDDLLAWEKSNAGGCSAQQSSANWPLETETWIHLIATSQGTQVDFFIDGNWVNSVEFDEPFNFTGSVFSIGARYVENCNGGEPCSGPGNAWNGAIDDVGIWNRALTNDEILALYNAELPTPGCTDPTACNFVAQATSDDGSCIPSGCMEPLACNYNALAECEGEACDYTCCPGPGCCLDGTTWDAELGGCVPEDPNDAIANSCPHDIDFDGLIGVVDLMDLLSVFGTDCPETSDPGGDPETIEFTCGDPINYQGHDYATVQIGEQCWFAENLRYVPEVSPVALGSEDDGMPHAYVYGYNGSSPEEAMLTANYSTYGALYNYEAIDEWNLCPEGWSNPTLAKWNVLTSSHTAAECVSVEWFGNNQTGFNLLPGGDRDGVEGFNSFNNLGSAGLIWISENPPKHVGVLNQNWYEYENPTAPSFGLSIRCLKDQ